MARVAIVFTGGTISMRHDPAAGGNVPVLGGEALLATVPGLDRTQLCTLDALVPDLRAPVDRGPELGGATGVVGENPGCGRSATLGSEL